MGFIVNLIIAIIGFGIAYLEHLAGAPDWAIFMTILLFTGVFAISIGADGIDLDIFD